MRSSASPSRQAGKPARGGLRSDVALYTLRQLNYRRPRFLGFSRYDSESLADSNLAVDPKGQFTQVASKSSESPK